MMVPWWSLVSRGWCIIVIFVILLESVQVDLYGSMMAWFLVGKAHMKKDWQNLQDQNCQPVMVNQQHWCSMHKIKDVPCMQTWGGPVAFPLSGIRWISKFNGHPQCILYELENALWMSIIQLIYSLYIIPERDEYPCHAKQWPTPHQSHNVLWD